MRREGVYTHWCALYIYKIYSIPDKCWKTRLNFSIDTKNEQSRFVHVIYFISFFPLCLYVIKIFVLLLQCYKVHKIEWFYVYMGLDGYIGNIGGNTRTKVLVKKAYGQRNRMTFSYKIINKISRLFSTSIVTQCDKAWMFYYYFFIILQLSPWEIQMLLARVKCLLISYLAWKKVNWFLLSLNIWRKLEKKSNACL